jgi:hypothetical protein
MALDMTIRSATQSLLASLAIAACFAAHGAAAQTPTQAYESPELRYRVALPTACRHEEGPGTLEAICDPMLDPELSKEAAAATAFFLEIEAEKVAATAPAYGEDEFRADAPEHVCGEGDRAKVKLSAIDKGTQDGVTTFSAEVVCPPIRFLGVPERKALVRTVVSPGFRHRLMVRALAADLDRLRPIAQAFLASFKLLPETKP